ncbi:Creatinase/Prolidase N-terminal domain-containing protein [Malonomonas rubra DSM 5091]|uniref:Creatinase/Prolidase N-terminal domain-containing protein n=1 Tax=Malonomonas rubra DSM 5091 TaxID=1122189 RepID=A0A1M6CKT4_MALRU|nr:Xaa-Pro peptidase family protein [Malonomonas rubra]SHI61616.1 Creatinase/Prolidase N-terminal domain-containing protein [Malonomonas rubra DSM 5091]
MRFTPATELTTRYKSLQKRLQQHQLDAALLVQNSDLFYFTGSVQQGFYYLPAEGEPVYLVRKDFGRARMECGLQHVLPLASSKQLFAILREQGIALPQKIAMELDVLPVRQYKHYQKLLAPADIVDASPLVREVRAIKSDYEISIMKDCALIMDKVFQRAKDVIAVGRTDWEVLAELEQYAKGEGHQGLIRFRGFNGEAGFGHLFSGSDGAVPTYSDTPLGGLGPNPAVGQGASYKKIAAGEPIILDLVIAYEGYMVDQTRTFSIGKLPDQLSEAYMAMLKVQEKMSEVAKPGVAWGTVYQQCLQLATDMGYKDHFMGASGAQVSFIGHGIGIELDECPFIARGFDQHPLEENMTFAFEPKVVFPGLGALGVENSWRVAAEGVKRLTYSDETLLEL